MTPAEAWLEIKAHKHREDQHYGFQARVAALQINVHLPKNKHLKPEDLYRPHLKPPGGASLEPEALTPEDRQELRRRAEEIARKHDPNK